MSDYTADIEPLASCLRVYPAGADSHRDPYVMSASVLWHDRHTAELKGVTQRSIDQAGEESDAGDDSRGFMKYRQAIALALYRMGCDWMVWTRKRTDGRPDRMVKLPTKRWATCKDPDR